jgi:hypothetical protein
MTSVGITVPGSTTSVLYTVPPPAYQQAVVLDSGSTCENPFFYLRSPFIISLSIRSLRWVGKCRILF